MIGRRAWWLLAVTFGLFSSSSWAQDVSGGKDHPLITRYEGSTIVKYGRKAFEKYTLALGPQVFGGDATGRSSISLSKSRQVSGQLTRITYLAPEGRSALEIFGNYEQALEKAEFDILYRCIESSCGQRFASATFPLREQELPGSVGTAGIEEQHYIAAHHLGMQGDIFIAVYVYFDKARFVGSSEISKAMLAQLDIVEVKDMEGGKVRVNAEMIAKEIARTGHIALYEIFFDTDKATLKPESDPTLAEIAKFLADSPEINLYVVGHTDSTGTFEHNMDLSKRRASAVVTALVKRYKVAATRLAGHGVGMLAPVSTNDTDEGRGRNRRVELVKK